MDEWNRSQTGVYDQDVYNQWGYLSDAHVRLRRGSRSAPLGAYRAAPAARPKAPPRLPLVGPKPKYMAPKPPSKVGLVVPLIVLMISIAGLGYAAVDRLASPADTAQAAAVDTAPAVVGPVATTALFMQVDGTGAPVGLTAASLADNGDASVVFIPVSIMVEVPGFGLDTITAAERVGGTDLAVLALENLLTIEFDHVVITTPAGVTELVRSFDPLLVNNPRRVDEATSRDRVQVVYPSGAILLPAADSADFLERHALGETDLERMVRHQEFWRSLLLARAEVAGDVTDIAADAEQFLDQLALHANDIEFRIIDVDQIGGAEELYGVDRDALDDLIVRLDPARGDGGVVRTRIQLLNGAGVPGLAAPIASMLVAERASIELVDNAAHFNHEVTQIVYYRDDQREAALRVAAALGVGEVVKQLETIDVVDLTIVAGADLAVRLNVAGDGAAAVRQDVSETTPADDSPSGR